jgi:hypothetical protein
MKTPTKKMKRVKAWAVYWPDDACLSGGWGGGSYAVFPFKGQAKLATSRVYGLSKVIPCTITFNLPKITRK